MQTPADGLRRVTREEMKLIDSVATSSYGIQALVLMENAGREVSEAVQEALRALRGGPAPVAVFASTGNNGGDGLVAARYLANAGCPVVVLLVGRSLDAMTPETMANLKILKRMGIPVDEIRHPLGARESADRCGGVGAVVDALLGTGFSAISGGLQEPISSAIDTIERLGAGGTPVIAADIPSGLDANTGQVIGKAVHAAHTVTFGLPKNGFFAPGAPAYVGRLTVADIGFPRALLDTQSPERE